MVESRLVAWSEEHSRYTPNITHTHKNTRATSIERTNERTLQLTIEQTNDNDRACSILSASYPY